AFSPDHETSISFDGEGYILNRKILPQKQLNDALNVGIEIKYNLALRNVMTENDRVIGIEGEDLQTKSAFKKTCKVVVDCTGVTSVLRTNLPITTHIQRKINRDDLEATGRYIYNFENQSEDNTYFDPDYCLIHLDQNIAPGGYAWVFPKGKNKVNIGLGVQQKAMEEHNRKQGERKDLKTKIDDYVKLNPVIKNPQIADGESDDGNSWGTWQVSVRRQNDCLAANGYILVGDSAWMPKPLDAGGIGPAIIAATIAGKTVVESIQANDFSEESLWKYNLEFVEAYGYKTAGLEVFRRLLQKLSNDQINYGMKHFLSKLDVDNITNGEHPEFGMVDKLNMFIHGALNKRLAEDLKTTAEVNKKLVSHYHNYPTNPNDFPEWQKSLSKTMSDAFIKLGCA
ncbi:MAG TPA: NAD(P)/FAD-dependent oxidoreductase, partial [Nitrososphaeraceae archaeon]|nr:NAD(P)/FAD-dependent oxidoreductase [Nitrososphaeraceae archaeon]